MTRPRTPGGRLAAWAELLRVSAAFSVPGDALAGAAASGARPGRRTLFAAGSSLCLYEAGMALNDWADREEDRAERPHRPLPSGRISPTAALTAAAGLTAAGLGLAAAAGRPALATASVLAGTVWLYDLKLAGTPAGPAGMAAARTLDVLLGATATARTGAAARTALPAAALLGAHTYAVTSVSRHETRGGSTRAPLGALATTAATAATVAGLRRGAPTRLPADRREAAAPGPPGPRAARTAARVGLAALYGTTAAVPYLHAALNPSPPLTQRAVGGGIRAMIPLQAALSARAGALGGALATLALVPLARLAGKKVSAT
ncbi:UbiA family prenyltransferase [Streptomyces sp. CHA1]|nr:MULTISPECIES: UbiA family prenyltransferase [unclassified Streptomyces]WSB23580.1 UbiA family prenyltransferase [Streptomyces albidoflavus]MBT3155978.1 UbiA family prenyltransferase [Streptomyces sp. G11C]MCO6699588.1 UbiA family prenyltransferase [Streptomyces sp. CHB9.2]MCO6705733.1 UbiA family prenyltransferase [Streptomyces sp. CHA3]MCO6717741.1 UbiA family prenyltransferase [Streptomyces sp. Vc714c-19]